MKLSLFNRTPYVNSFLCFTNMAVPVNDNYQVIFPPRTQFGTQHAKREFVGWPIARSAYNGVDFTDRVDFFAIFGKPGDTSVNLVQGHYLSALGCLGLERIAAGVEHLRQVLRSSPNHQHAGWLLEEWERQCP